MAVVEKEIRKTALRKGDTVMIIAGGNKNSRPLKGKTAKIVRFVGASKVILEGMNMVTRHRKASGPGNPGGKVQKEAPVHISRIMFFSDKANRPVRIRHKFLEDGTKVRGYLDAKSKEFVQIDSK